MAVHGPKLLLDLVFSSRDGLVRDVKVGGTLGFSSHEMVEFRISCRRSKAKSMIAILDFQGVNSDLFQGLLGGISWATVQAHGSLATFKQHFFQAQDLCIPKRRKVGKGGRRPAWMSKELMDKVKGKMNVYEMWKKGQSFWDDYRSYCQGLHGSNEEG